MSMNDAVREAAELASWQGPAGPRPHPYIWAAAVRLCCARLGEFTPKLRVAAEMDGEHSVSRRASGPGAAVEEATIPTARRIRLGCCEDDA